MNYLEIIERQVVVVQTAGGSHSEENPATYYVGVWCTLVNVSFVMSYSAVKMLKIASKII